MKNREEKHIKQILKRFFAPLKNKKGMILASLWVILMSVFQIFEVAIVKNLVDTLEAKNPGVFYTWIGLGILGALGVWIFGYWIRPKTEAILYETIQQTYDFAMPEFFRLDQQQVEKLGTGKIQEIVGRGIDVWGRTLYGTLYDGIGVFIILISSLMLIFKSSIKIGLIGVCIIAVSILWIWYRNKQEKRKRHLAKNEQISLSQGMIRQIMSKFEIVQSNKIPFEIEKIKKIRHNIIEKEVVLERHKYLTYQSLQFSLTIFGFLVGGILGMLVFGSQATLGEFVFLMGLFGLLTKSIGKITEWLRSFTRESVHIEKLWELLDTAPRGKSESFGKPFTFKRGDFSLKDLSFSYENGEKNIFHHFSLNLKGGTKTAFVGESGGGKTTLIKLLAGYIRPDQGVIEIDGQDLSALKLSEYYQHIGYLTQDPSVFDGTLYENLVYALKEAPSDQEISKIIHLAKCEFIFEFEQGLKTEIGERGVRLSGGQKQRLAIAKIMLKNPEIILLDEPTSALDSFNEELISIAFQNLFQGKTVLIVAHRLQTVRQAERILYISGGTVLEDGTHEELVAQNGRYKKMLELQSGF